MSHIVYNSLFVKCPSILNSSNINQKRLKLLFSYGIVFDTRLSLRNWSNKVPFNDLKSVGKIAVIDCTAFQRKEKIAQITCRQITALQNSQGSAFMEVLQTRWETLTKRQLQNRPNERYFKEQFSSIGLKKFLEKKSLCLQKSRILRK